MGKSFRKTPIIGIGSRSEKKDKQLINRRIRRRSKRILEEGDLEDIQEAMFPKQNEVMDPWNMAKDGKMYVPKNSEFYDKSIRK